MDDGSVVEKKIFTLTYSGEAFANGEIDPKDLVAAVQGFDRFLKGLAAVGGQGIRVKCLPSEQGSYKLKFAVGMIGAEALLPWKPSFDDLLRYAESAIDFFRQPTQSITYNATYNGCKFYQNQDCREGLNEVCKPLLNEGDNCATIEADSGKIPVTKEDARRISDNLREKSSEETQPSRETLITDVTVARPSAIDGDLWKFKTIKPEENLIKPNEKGFFAAKMEDKSFFQSYKDADILVSPKAGMKAEIEIIRTTDKETYVVKRILEYESVFQPSLDFR